jgi:hypothetical protein
MKKVVFLSFLAVLAYPFFSFADMVSEERESLRIKYEEKSRRCADMRGAGNRGSCNTKALNDYNAKLSLLSENPDLYFENKYGSRGKGRSGDRGIDQGGGNHGFVDNYGRHYSPAGGENVIRDEDGTLMQKAAGGYIDTKTGKFIPAN